MGALGMAARGKAATGQREDLAAKPPRIEQKRGIDRGQAGADQNDAVVVRQPLRDVRAPRIGAIAGDRRVDAGRGVRRQVAQRQHRDVGGDPRTIGHGQRDAGAGAVDRADLARHQPQPPARLCGGGIQHGAQIGAVDAPGHEAVAIPLALARQPFDEMAGFVGQGAHPLGADVEQVIGMRRAIGDAARQLLGPPLDQGHARPLMPEEVDREQGARETGADDHDMIGVGGEKQVGLGHRRTD